MAGTVVVGAQWGDEGKGKFVDLMSADMDFVVRYQGGHNAGHTIVIDEERFTLQLIPCGIMYDHVTPVIGNGVVVDPKVLVEEIEALEARGVSCEKLKLSGNAHLIFPYHQEIDEAIERRLGDAKLGTTKRGIGPAYADKAARVGIRAQDLLDKDIFIKKLEISLSEKNLLLSKVYGRAELDLDEIVQDYLTNYKDQLSPYIADTVSLLNDALADEKNEKRVLFEGAQATFLDLDHGTYPFVTSSNCSAGGAATGSGVGPRHLTRIIGVAKAYSTRVGSGPFPTELDDEVGARIAEVGDEFGTNTGRARRIGWFDAVMLRHAVNINTMTELAITKLDVLDGIDELKVCVAYEVNGKKLDGVPYHQTDFHDAKPIYETFSGWDEAISAVESRDGLPSAAQDYLKFLEAEVGVPITLVGVGPGRAQFLQWSEV